MLVARSAVVSESQSLAAAVTANHIRDGFRWGEAKSYAHHGAPSVSNALASAFWGIDVMLTSPNYDSAGVNFHGDSTGMDGTVPFTDAPILETSDRVTSASPLFYGVLLVARAGTRPMLATTAKAGSLNFSGYTIAPSDRGLNVVLVNKDATNGIHASIDTGAAVVFASVVHLQGSSLGATIGETFASADVDSDRTVTLAYAARSSPMTFGGRCQHRRVIGTASAQATPQQPLVAWRRRAFRLIRPDKLP